MVLGRRERERHWVERENVGNEGCGREGRRGEYARRESGMQRGERTGEQSATCTGLANDDARCEGESEAGLPRGQRRIEKEPGTLVRMMRRTALEMRERVRERK